MVSENSFYEIIVNHGGKMLRFELGGLFGDIFRELQIFSSFQKNDV